MQGIVCLLVLCEKVRVTGVHSSVPFWAVLLSQLVEVRIEDGIAHAMDQHWAHKHLHHLISYKNIICTFNMFIREN